MPQFLHWRGKSKYSSLIMDSSRLHCQSNYSAANLFKASGDQGSLNNRGRFGRVVPVFGRGAAGTGTVAETLGTGVGAGGVGLMKPKACKLDSKLFGFRATND